ncbi:hypothetical protein AB0N07_40880, partial [Streptomyces sp. NPDC051172]
MRVHTTTVLSLSALAVLALTGCSTGSAAPIRPTPGDRLRVRFEGFRVTSVRCGNIPESDESGCIGYRMV